MADARSAGPQGGEGGEGEGTVTLFDEPLPALPVDWRRLDPDAYVAGNYADPYVADLRLAELLRRAWAELGPGRRMLEVGAGPNIYPVLIALAHGAEVEISDLHPANLDYVRGQARRLDPHWLHFLHGLPPGHSDRLATVRTSLRNLFSLPAETWDVLSMNFVIESVTDSRENLARGIAAVAGALEPGGTLLSSHMLGFTGSEYAGERFDAVPFTLDEIRAEIAEHLEIVETEILPQGEQLLRPGYSGMAFVRSVRR